MRPSFIFALLVLSLITPLASGQTTYPLVCRGGGDLYFTYTPYSNLSPQPQIWIGFVRGSRGVGANRENLAVLQPGQCSWLDRAVAPAEPDKIALLNVEQFAIHWQRGQVMGIGSQFASINALQNPGQYQTFDVYNNGKGFFVAAGALPNAAKTPASSAQEEGVRRTIRGDGVVEIHYPDGSIKILDRPCGWTMRFPDGRAQTVLCSTNVQPGTAPPLPSSPENIQWLKNESEDLLTVIKWLVGNDKDAVQRYLSYEGSASEYDQIEKRTGVIRKLVQP